MHYSSPRRIEYSNKSKYESKRKEKTPANKAKDNFIELFGINLYFDDILIICLLFFLYQEKVKDTELFICLILLLLT